MEKEKLPLKTRIITGLVQGLIFAIGMEAFYYFDGDGFSIWRFLFHGSFFGFFMALAFRYRVKRKVVMSLKREKISLKIRIVVGVIQAVALAVTLGLWDYYSGEELQNGRYIFQGIMFSLLMSWMFRYKVVNERK